MSSKIPIFEKKNVLVTGGAGFIGSHLCEALLQSAKVICLDNLSSGSLSNIDHLLRNPDFIFIKADVASPLQFDLWPELSKFKVPFQGIQEIYHLASPTAPKRFNNERIEILKTNGTGTLQLLELAVHWHAKFFFASSSVIYGAREKDGGHVQEDHEGTFDHLSTRASYDEGKRFGETVTNTYAQVHGVPTRIGRIFRTYGPRTPLGAGEMLPDFIVSAIEGKPLTLYGTNDFKTSLCYITDMVDGILKLMNSEDDPGPVNLGSDEDHNLADVAKMIIEMTSSSSKIVFEPPLLFMRPQPLPDIRRAKEALSWFPITRLQDGLKKMIEYTMGQQHLLNRVK